MALTNEELQDILDNLTPEEQKASLISFWVSFIRLVCSPCFKTILIKHVYYSLFKL
jgi:hypothetical protein